MVEQEKQVTVEIISSIELAEKIKNEKEQTNIMSGIPALDMATQGFSVGQVVAMTGHTKSGKTSFCQTLTLNYAYEGIGCLWFSYEMTPREFLKKFPENNLPLFYLPDPLSGTTLKWIEARIVQSKEKFNSEVVFIDHLHYLVPMQGNQNMSVLIGGVMRELKKIALRHSVLIFILAHTSQPKSDKAIGLEDIRDSSFVAQESDFVLAISRPRFDEDDETTYYDTTAKLRVLANRRTGMRVCINLDYREGTYKEIPKP